MTVGFPTARGFRELACESLVSLYSHTLSLHIVIRPPANQGAGLFYFSSASALSQSSLSSLSLTNLHEFIHLLNCLPNHACMLTCILACMHACIHPPPVLLPRFQFNQSSLTIKAFCFCFCLCVCAGVEVRDHDQSWMVILTFLFIWDRVSCCSLLSRPG